MDIGIDRNSFSALIFYLSLHILHTVLHEFLKVQMRKLNINCSRKMVNQLKTLWLMALRFPFDTQLS